MDRLRTRFVCIAAPAALLAPLLTGCVDNNSTMFIRQMQAPDAEGDCLVTDGEDGLHWTEGYFDVSLAQSYGGTVLVGNQVQERGDETTGKVETSAVQLYEAEIETFDYSGATISSFTMPTTGFIDQASGTTPSYGLAGVVLVDPGAAGAVGAGQTLISRVKIYGETLGGLEVETGWWDFPIFVCDGCLGCECPATIDAEYTLACRPGNNESVDCREKPCWDPAANSYCGCQLTTTAP
jgi:hypothetical protein